VSYREALADGIDRARLDGASTPLGTGGCAITKEEPLLLYVVGG
jgi:hypothetical protein